MLHTKLSRRTVIKLGGALGVAAPVFFARTHGSHAAPLEQAVTKTRRPFARALNVGVPVREQPGLKSKQVRVLKWNEVIPINGQTESNDSPRPHNKIWYRTTDGWVHSQFMQPAENTPQKPVDKVPAEGYWGEVFVPSTLIRVAPKPDAASTFRIPFGTTFQMLDLVEGSDKAPWYRISDGRSDKLYVVAEALRKIVPEEFQPISPEVPLDHKRIDVDIRKQVVVAYENDTEVWRARCATGAYFRQDDGTVQDYTTTPGDHRIFLKTPSRRMSGGREGEGDFYDLPGIPWVAYFTTSRIAFHGAYWHNDFGIPRSHGCVNLLPEDAQWVYRWTLPAAPYFERWTQTARKDEGSLVRVF
jgi:lipoprotein-anchoring transpeptidase ErfK/SrfK